MHAREKLFASPLFGDDIKKLLPIIEPTGSDSAMFDNALELLVRTGRSLPHAVMMMIPEAWQNDEQMSADKRAFYEYHSCLMEPWDGPASIAFTDGRRIGAVLDRNGLRPSRYVVTKDGLVVMASEVGVLDIPPEQRRAQGPPAAGPHVPGRHRGGPHRRRRGDQGQRWRRASRIGSGSTRTSSSSTSFPSRPTSPPIDGYEADDLLKQQQAFGYTIEDLKMLMAPMAANGQEPVGSMGTDTPLAVLSDKSAAAVQLLQAAVRAGHQSADRSDPRRAGDVGRDHDRRRAEPVRRDARSIAASSS